MLQHFRAALGAFRSDREPTRSVFHRLGLEHSLQHLLPNGHAPAPGEPLNGVAKVHQIVRHSSTTGSRDFLVRSKRRRREVVATGDFVPTFFETAQDEYVLVDLSTWQESTSTLLGPHWTAPFARSRATTTPATPAA